MTGVSYSVTESKVTAITDGVVTTNEMISDFENHYISIAFFSDSKKTSIVSKSLMVGDVVLEATINGKEWGKIQVGGNGEGLLTLGGDNELVGSMCGDYLKVRATLNITNASTATHAQLTISNYKG